MKKIEIENSLINYICSTLDELSNDTTHNSTVNTSIGEELIAYSSSPTTVGGNKKHYEMRTNKCINERLKSVVSKSLKAISAIWRWQATTIRLH